MSRGQPHQGLDIVNLSEFLQAHRETDSNLAAVRPLGLDLIYVYPRNPVCARRFKILLFQSLVSHYTDTHFYILSLDLALLL